MTTVCLIGNSHLAPLKRGLPEVQLSFPEMMLDFYAATAGWQQLEPGVRRHRPARRLTKIRAKSADIRTRAPSLE